MYQHHSNLCDLSQEQQQAIEIDKQRWFRAYKMVRSMMLNEIKIKLESMPTEEKNDMRIKLNTCYAKRFEK